MDKYGKTSAMIVLLGIIAAVVVIAGGYYVYNASTEQAVIGGNQNTGNTGGVNNIVTTLPKINVNAYDAATPGTALTSTLKGSINGANFATVTSGTTEITPADTLVLLVSNSTYHAAKVDQFTVKVNSFPIGVAMNKNASVTMTAINSNNVVMNGGAATNQTVAAGDSPTITLKMKGTAKASTQDMICILDESNKTAVDGSKGITLSGATPVTIPMNFYSNGANSYLQAVSVAALTSGNEVISTLQVNGDTNTGKTLAGSNIKITCYTKENFVDSNTGKLAFDIQDSTGALQSIASYTTTLYFDA